MARAPFTPLFDLDVADLEHILRLAGADLESLRGKNFFITGGTGFFGKWLLTALAQADAALELNLRATVLSRDPGIFLQRHPSLGEIRGLNFVRGEVDTFPFPDGPFDFVIHAAADTTWIATEAGEDQRTRAILHGTLRVLDLAERSGTQRVLHVSSGAVYGALVGQPTGASEDDFTRAEPTTAYGMAKHTAELECDHSVVDCVHARAFAFLGPHLPLDAHFAAGNFLRDARRGGPILVRGDGTALRSYLHPADLVVWLLRLLVRGEPGRAYNVGSDEVVSIARLARLIAGSVQPTPEVTIQSMQAHGPQNIYLPNIARARTELGLDVAIPLADAIARTLRFLDKTDAPTISPS